MLYTFCSCITCCIPVWCHKHNPVKVHLSWTLCHSQACSVVVLCLMKCTHSSDGAHRTKAHSLLVMSTAVWNNSSYADSCWCTNYLSSVDWFSLVGWAEIYFSVICPMGPCLIDTLSLLYLSFLYYSSIMPLGTSWSPFQDSSKVCQESCVRCMEWVQLPDLLVPGLWEKRNFRRSIF